MKDHVWKLIAVVAVVAIGGSIVYSNSVSNKANDGIELVDHVKGNPDAAVTLVEYSDFQCPACAQFYKIVEEVLAEQGDNIRFEYKHFPLIKPHPYAVPAAKAAEAAGQQGKFFKMHDKLFENQQIWSNSANVHSHFNKYAEEIGLDVGLFKQHMRASVIQDKITEEMNEGRELGIPGTPSFFLNGKRMEFEMYQEFVDQITSAIAAANEEGVKDETQEGVSAPQASAETSVRFGF